MRYLSLCSGIEAASVAWRPLSWEAVAFSEVSAFPSAVLARHFPHTQNLGDMAKVQDWRQYRGAVDLVVAGTPCQDFSVAGKRAGMAGARSGLALVFAQVLSVVRPRWIVWENVPGVFSTNGGRDFGTFLRALDNIGYPCAWRVLDAQFFGVPQRRRRVFVVGHLGDWRPAAAVLFERESVCGHPSPRGQAPKDLAGTLEAGIGRSRGAGTPPGALISTQVPYVPRIVGQAMSCKWSKGTSGPAGDEHHNLVASLAFTERCRKEGRTLEYLREQAYCLMNPGSGGRTHSRQILTPQLRVRRLTPRECERLQGFPDDYTAIEYRGKPAADGPRYRALGNSMAVPVMRWIGQRIAAQERL